MTSFGEEIVAHTEVRHDEEPLPDVVEELYLATLSRKPTPEESAKLVAYVNKGGPSGDRDRALADVFWVLLNSSEFLLNH